MKKSSTELNVESEGAVRTKRLTPGSDLPAPLPVTLQGHEPVQHQHPHGRQRDDTFLPGSGQAITSTGGGGPEQDGETQPNPRCSVADTVPLRTGFFFLDKFFEEEEVGLSTFIKVSFSSLNFKISLNF